MRVLAVFLALITGQALAQPVFSRPASGSPGPTLEWTAIPDGAISRLDVRAGIGVGVGGATNGGLLEASVSLTAESPYLGPFSAQVRGTYGRTSTDFGERDVSGIALGLGVSEPAGPLRIGVMGNVWSQARGRDISPAYSLEAGVHTALAGSVGAYGGVRAMVSDIRSTGDEAELVTLATAGVNVAF